MLHDPEISEKYFESKHTAQEHNSIIICAIFFDDLSSLRQQLTMQKETIAIKKSDFCIAILPA